MVLTDLPILVYPPQVLATLDEGGKFISNDNFGDGTIIIAGGKLRMTFRSGVPASMGNPNGCQYQEKDDDGNLITQWPAPTGPGPETGLVRPFKAIVTNDGSNSGNIDTACLLWNPEAESGAGLFLSAHGVKPGTIPVTVPESGGISKGIHYWHSAAPTRLAASWDTPSPGVPIIDWSQHTEAIWAQPFPDGDDPPFIFDGGCAESSWVHDSDTGKVVIFWEGQYHDGTTEWNGNSLLRHAIGRAEVDAADFMLGSAPTFTWTPLPGATSYVWRPKENGFKEGESYGENNDDAVWGTSEKVTLRSHVSIGPDGPSGPWHLVLQQKRPNTGGGNENRTSGIGHWYSFDKGFTWTADLRNPLVTWDLMEFPDNGQANKFNSTHLLFDIPHNVGHLLFWGNDTPQGMNSPGTKLYALTFSLGLEAPEARLPGMNTERGKQALKKFYAA